MNFRIYYSAKNFSGWFLLVNKHIGQLGNKNAKNKVKKFWSLKKPVYICSRFTGVLYGY